MVVDAPPQLVARVNQAHAVVRNGGHQVIRYRANRAGRVRITVQRGRRCAKSWHVGSYLASGVTNKLTWRGTLDEVNHPGRYSTCALVKVPGLRRVVVAAPLTIRP